MWVDRAADLDDLLFLFVWVIVSASNNSWSSADTLETIISQFKVFRVSAFRA